MVGNLCLAYRIIFYFDFIHLFGLKGSAIRVNSFMRPIVLAGASGLVRVCGANIRLDATTINAAFRPRGGYQ